MCARICHASSHSSEACCELLYPAILLYFKVYKSQLPQTDRKQELVYQWQSRVQKVRKRNRHTKRTYNWKLSLNTGDQLLLFDLVASLRFLLLKFGPMMLTSTNGRNMPFVTHFMLLTATTEMQEACNLQLAIIGRRHHSL